MVIELLSCPGERSLHIEPLTRLFRTLRQTWRDVEAQLYHKAGCSSQYKVCCRRFCVGNQVSITKARSHHNTYSGSWQLTAAAAHTTAHYNHHMTAVLRVPTAAPARAPVSSFSECWVWKVACSLSLVAKITRTARKLNWDSPPAISPVTLSDLGTWGDLHTGS